MVYPANIIVADEVEIHGHDRPRSWPPILPFTPLAGSRPVSLAERPEDWSASGTYYNLPDQSHGMTDEQMQRLYVAQQFWPQHFDRMSSQQQRQVGPSDSRLFHAIRAIRPHRVASISPPTLTVGDGRGAAVLPQR